MYALKTLSLVAIATISVANAQQKATFTHYGSGDQNGSPNCATATNACGAADQYASLSTYTAALSQKQFGVGPGQGAGPACGTCYQLTIQTDLSGNPVTENSIKVVVNNLCPIDGNTICNVPNQYGGEIHFDLCSDTGAASAFFTTSGAGIGTAEEVAC
ncbi:RlpA-like double-psi beta-barrel-protein domain-containing protein-containing protein [Talaromyces proteolyticus]|uniref:RlpA-like double-psi beta-barrel-protein domain-containing protein-containing protein n=1 Tax=Talaromyces proteolyticus TaxID=1131652 RepID=A0AAD4KTM1_9EURO|nr:RlpA-like double-psi beta-barrel-protein domain-containing protein-containing protein [Talaromyces proteolyticus]KAH8699038.1 RlpA-like double-psi beta-barrel-protein domain-containing protein-containing protein [Talaromyces proteolyticus]